MPGEEFPTSPQSFTTSVAFQLPPVDREMAADNINIDQSHKYLRIIERELNACSKQKTRSAV
jgi:hypothetical protein